MAENLGGSGEGSQAIRRKRFKLLSGALVAAAIGGTTWWALTHNHETTDDAFIDGAVVGVAPQVGGRVLAVHFADNDVVHTGDLLVEIDPRDNEAVAAAARASLAAARARHDAAQATLELTRVTSGADYTRADSFLSGTHRQVDQARASAEAAQADAIRAAADVKRYQELFEGHNASRQRLEQAQADARATAARWRAAQQQVASSESQVAQAVAQLKSANTAAQLVAEKEAELALATAQADQAEADLKTAELNLSYTRLTAPQDGRVSKKGVEVGDSVQKGQTLTQLVAGRPWVVANFKETQLTRMRPNQPVTITVDAYSSVTLKGHVDSMQPGTGSRFALLPAENATGNYVKVVQRVPVKIVIDNPDDAPFLALGMSVVPDVDVGVEVKAPQ